MLDKDLKNVFEGQLLAAGMRLGIVCARFNDTIVERLLAGAVDCFVRHGGSAADIRLAWVPGSYEIPLVAKRLADGGKCDAVVCLGTVIQGATPHAGFINAQVANSLAAISQASGIPVTYGILTTETIEQALERSGIKHGNRGYDAAAAAIEMVNLLKSDL